MLSDNDVKISLVIALHENDNKNVYDLSHRIDLWSKVMTHPKQFQFMRNYAYSILDLSADGKIDHISVFICF